MTGGARDAVDSSVVRRTAPKPQTPPDFCLPNIQAAKGCQGCRARKLHIWQLRILIRMYEGGTEH